jgi:hypothetical protein
MGKRELWFFIFLIGALLFNWPLLDIFSLSLEYYLFGVWGAFIVLVGIFISVRRRRKTDINV